MSALMKRDPYWWVAAPLAQAAPQPVDTTCDVVIMGAGYTGLSAAITLARLSSAALRPLLRMR